MEEIITIEKTLPKRKNIRLKGYNYSQNGYYFITLCTQNREKLFGEIVGGGDLDTPKIQLTRAGKIVDKYTNSIEKAYANVKVDIFTIMPNHIHIILIINNLKNGTSGSPSPTNALIPTVISVFKRLTNKEYGASIWQRGYHDHIIRNEQDYKEICEYI
jgi:putative transposase